MRKKLALSDYQANADECQRMADLARDPAHKRNWLMLAESWLGMIPKASEPPLAGAGQDDQRTGQDS